MKLFDRLLAHNARFVETGFRRELTIVPSAGTMVVGCVDPRVDPAVILGLEQGEVVVIRNVGGRVDRRLLETLAVLRVVAKAVGAQGSVRNIVLLHHTDCGIIGCYHHAPALLARHLEAEAEGLEAFEITDPYKSVVRDISALRADGGLPDGVIVAGLVYDVRTGRVDVVAPPAPLRSKG